VRVLCTLAGGRVDDLAAFAALGVAVEACLAVMRLSPIAA
jgi:hypothetical protein